ncbi:MAG: MFS transporter [Clostridia bacterium]|nr:MFS transporter [Clostridia bacterium]
MKNDILTTDGFTNWKRKIILFLAGQNASLFGTSLVQYIIIWYITLETGSGTMMMIGTLCAVLPQVIIGLFAGVWADRFNRKSIIILADSMIAVCTLVIALLFMFGINDIWLLFLVMALRSLGSGLQAPAVSALIPQLVPPEKLMKVNGYHTSLSSIIMLLSPAAGGAMLAVAPMHTGLFIDVITAAIGVGFLLLIPVHKVVNQQSRVNTYFKDLFSGIKYVFSHRLIRRVMLLYAIFYFCITPAAILTPLLVTRSYGPEIWRLTANEMLFSGGTIIGGIIIAAWGGFKNRLLTMAYGLTALGALNTLLGTGFPFWAYLVCIGAMGVIVPLVSSPTVVLLQEKVENEIQGRVFGIFGIITSAAFPAGILLFGPIADIIDIEYMLMATGAVIVAMGIMLLINKSFLAMGKKETFTQQ